MLSIGCSSIWRRKRLLCFPNRSTSTMISIDGLRSRRLKTASATLMSEPREMRTAVLTISCRARSRAVVLSLTPTTKQPALRKRLSRICFSSGPTNNILRPLPVAVASANIRVTSKPQRNFSPSPVPTFDRANFCFSGSLACRSHSYLERLTDLGVNATAIRCTRGCALPDIDSGAAHAAACVEVFCSPG